MSKDNKLYRILCDQEPPEFKSNQEHLRVVWICKKNNTVWKQEVVWRRLSKEEFEKLEQESDVQYINAKK